jgi:hypothetical protein
MLEDLLIYFYEFEFQNRLILPMDDQYGNHHPLSLLSAHHLNSRIILIVKSLPLKVVIVVVVITTISS